MTNQPIVEGRLLTTSELFDMCQKELARIYGARPVWVMNLDWYKTIRGSSPQVNNDDPPETWVPSPEDRMFGLPFKVHESGGMPHIEWLPPNELKPREPDLRSDLEVIRDNHAAYREKLNGQEEG